LSFGKARAPVAPVPATGALGFLRKNVFLNRPRNGMMVTRANQGVAHTLKINRKGSSSFVIAYAVANLRRSQHRAM